MAIAQSELFPESRQNLVKVDAKGILGAPWSDSGAPWTRFGASWGRLGRLGASLKSAWDGFGAFLSAYGRFCEACFGVPGHLGASLGALRHDFRTKLQNFILDILL